MQNGNKLAELHASKILRNWIYSNKSIQLESSRSQGRVTQRFCQHKIRIPQRDNDLSHRKRAMDRAQRWITFQNNLRFSVTASTIHFPGYSCFRKSVFNAQLWCCLSRSTESTQTIRFRIWWQVDVHFSLPWSCSIIASIVIIIALQQSCCCQHTKDRVVHGSMLWLKASNNKRARCWSFDAFQATLFLHFISYGSINTTP